MISLLEILPIDLILLLLDEWIGDYHGKIPHSFRNLDLALCNRVLRWKLLSCAPKYLSKSERGFVIRSERLNELVNYAQQRNIYLNVLTISENDHLDSVTVWPKLTNLLKLQLLNLGRSLKIEQLLDKLPHLRSLDIFGNTLFVFDCQSTTKNHQLVATVHIQNKNINLNLQSLKMIDSIWKSSQDYNCFLIWWKTRLNNLQHIHIRHGNIIATNHGSSCTLTPNFLLPLLSSFPLLINLQIYNMHNCSPSTTPTFHNIPIEIICTNSGDGSPEQNSCKQSPPFLLEKLCLSFNPTGYSSPDGVTEYSILLQIMEHSPKLHTIHIHCFDVMTTPQSWSEVPATTVTNTPQDAEHLVDTWKKECRQYPKLRNVYTCMQRDHSQCRCLQKNCNECNGR